MFFTLGKWVARGVFEMLIHIQCVVLPPIKATHSSHKPKSLIILVHSLPLTLGSEIWIHLDYKVRRQSYVLLCYTHGKSNGDPIRAVLMEPLVCSLPRGFLCIGG
jgi:hypothetical protein